MSKISPVQYESVHDISGSTNAKQHARVQIGTSETTRDMWSARVELYAFGPSADAARASLVKSLRKIADELDATKIS